MTLETIRFTVLQDILHQRQNKRPGIFPGLVCRVDGLMD